MTISRDYFRLRKPLERRLYELARKHCGRQPEWKITLDHLREKCGALSPLKNFRFQLRSITQANHLPDYTLSLDNNNVVTFTNRRCLVQHSPSGVLLGFEPLPALRDDTVQRGARLVEEAETGWNYQAIRAQFTEQLVKGFRPKNVNAAFIGFVKKKVTHQP